MSNCSIPGSTCGYTLTELLVVTTLVGLVTSISIPSFAAFLTKNQVTAAAEGIYSLVLQAQSEGSIRDTDLSFNTVIENGSWCAGFSSTPDCDCTDISSCAVEVADTDVLQVLKSAEFEDVSITENFAEGGGTRFDRIRGSVSQAGTLSVSSGDYQLRIVISRDGRTRICNSNDQTNPIDGYVSC